MAIVNNIHACLFIYIYIFIYTHMLYTYTNVICSMRVWNPNRHRRRRYSSRLVQTPVETTPCGTRAPVFCNLLLHVNAAAAVAAVTTYRRSCPASPRGGAYVCPPVRRMRAFIRIHTSVRARACVRPGRIIIVRCTRALCTMHVI